MKYLGMYLIPVVLSLTGWMVYSTFDLKGYIGYGHVKQMYYEGYRENYIATICKKDGEIVKIWLDPIDSILAHPGLPKQRREMGKILLKSLR